MIKNEPRRENRARREYEQWGESMENDIKEQINALSKVISHMGVNMLELENRVRALEEKK